MLTTLSGLSACCWTVSFTELILSTVARFQQKKGGQLLLAAFLQLCLLAIDRVTNAITLVSETRTVSAVEVHPTAVLALIFVLRKRTTEGIHHCARRRLETLVYVVAHPVSIDVSARFASV